MSLNVFVCEGNVVRDPEFQTVGKGTPLAKFSLASSERKKNSQTGQYEEYVSFFDFTAWGKDAEWAKQWLSKGKPIAVVAHAQQERWQSKTGENRSAVRFTVDRFYFTLGNKRTTKDEDDDGDESDRAAVAAFNADRGEGIPF